jgi:hypothetical protein
MTKLLFLLLKMKIREGREGERGMRSSRECSKSLTDDSKVGLG